MKSGFSSHLSDSESHVAIYHISCTLNISFNSGKTFRDTKICKNFEFQGVWTELTSEFYFFRLTFIKYFETNLQNQIM